MQDSTATMTRATDLENLLIDTWWFGLSRRMDDVTFESLATQRAREGFNAIQLVVGIPPEVAPGNKHATSDVGVPWNLEGNINQDYLKLARRRIHLLNSLGLRVIVYGGWGMQIEWTGVKFMKRWWQQIIRTLNDLDVIYCVTGEVDLWIDMPNILLPDRSTDNLRGGAPVRPDSLRRKAEKVAKKLLIIKTRLLKPYAASRRRHAWGTVMEEIRKQSKRTIIVHPGGIPNTSSHQLIEHTELLDAICVQTGHDQASRPMHWRLPMKYAHAEQRFINLEPWYEGIRDDFFADDQLYAYWCNMLGGACSFAYGAHGVWNAGDGHFLAHWGRQSLTEARELKTGRLLGTSHAWFLQHAGYQALGQSHCEEQGQTLVSLSRECTAGQFHFIPDPAKIDELPEGNYFDPARGEEIDMSKMNGQPIVIWQAN